MNYPNFTINILNDGYVAGLQDWHKIKQLADELHVRCITRRIPGGAKAGNINRALNRTKNPFIVIFDADHVPNQNFLKKTIGYLADPSLAFVQTPQFYGNHQQNAITQAAWRQQTLFFGPLMSGKNHWNAAFMCGTNLVVRRTALKSVGGMCEDNIAEDFLTSLFIHAKGWSSYYLPEVLAVGLAPQDFASYYKQQFRWTRGSLEVITKYNPFRHSSLSFAQKIQYLTSSSYYLNGFVVVVDALIPLIYLYTSQTAVNTSSMALAAVFIPYIFISLYTLQLSSNFAYSFKAVAFSISSCFLQINALWAVLINQKTAFAVTSKRRLHGNSFSLIRFHLIYIVLATGGLIVAFWREGLSASLLANAAWVLVTVSMFVPFVAAAVPRLLSYRWRRHAA